MAKRQETIEIEKVLHRKCKKQRLYGCEEVTIGFANNGHGNEVVDFCTMDSEGTLCCYEIKVTLADLKSKAKKSWYGHYNYLFVTEELWDKICEDIDSYIPKHVGVAIPNPNRWSVSGVSVVKQARRQNLTMEESSMLKESLVRSLYFKMDKYRETSDISTVSKLKSELRASEKDAKMWMNEATTHRFTLERLERALRLYYGQDIDFIELVPQITQRTYTLPEKIELQLNDNGQKYNQRVEELKKIEEETE